MNFNGSQFNLLKEYNQLLTELLDYIGGELTSLEHGPTTVAGTYSVTGNTLSSLAGAPRIVEKDFICHDNRLPTLKGGPREVGGSYHASKNLLTDLKGIAKDIHGELGIYGNKLTTLEGAVYVGSGIDASRNEITSFGSTLEFVGGRILLRPSNIEYEADMAAEKAPFDISGIEINGDIFW